MEKPIFINVEFSSKNADGSDLAGNPKPLELQIPLSSISHMKKNAETETYDVFLFDAVVRNILGRKENEEVGQYEAITRLVE